MFSVPDGKVSLAFQKSGSGINLCCPVSCLDSGPGEDSHGAGDGLEQRAVSVARHCFSPFRFVLTVPPLMPFCGRMTLEAFVFLCRVGLYEAAGHVELSVAHGQNVN